MKKNNFLTNKYTLSVFILLVCLIADILLHKGLTRVLLPDSFTEKRSPQNFIPCNQLLLVNKKEWIKAVNVVSKMEQISADAAGLEMDVYFDTAKNYLQLYHDSAGYSELDIETVLEVYKTRKLTSSIWLDFKNLSAANEIQSLKYISKLREQYGLQNKLIIESSSPQFLQSFCDSGFFTSYYIRFFNPYRISENELIAQIDTISAILKKYKVSALSGYYFQYPVMKKYFPNYPVLTWTDNSNISLISNSFNKILKSDVNVKVVLHP
jgi:hypothetical protein